MASGSLAAGVDVSVGAGGKIEGKLKAEAKIGGGAGGGDDGDDAARAGADAGGGDDKSEAAAAAGGGAKVPTAADLLGYAAKLRAEGGSKPGGAGGDANRLMSDSDRNYSPVDPHDTRELSRRLFRYASLVERLRDDRWTAKLVAHAHFNAQKDYEQALRWCTVVGLISAVLATCLPQVTGFRDAWGDTGERQIHPWAVSGCAFLALVMQAFMSHNNTQALSHSHAAAAWLTLFTRLQDFTYQLQAAIPHATLSVEQLDAEWSALQHRKMELDGERTSATTRKDITRARWELRKVEAKQTAIMDDQFAAIADAARHFKLERVPPRPSRPRPLDVAVCWLYDNEHVARADDPTSCAANWCCCCRTLRSSNQLASATAGAAAGAAAADHESAHLLSGERIGPTAGAVASAGGSVGSLAGTAAPRNH